MIKDKVDLLSDALSSGPDRGNNPELESWIHEQPDNERLHETLERIEVSSRIHEYAEQMRNHILFELNAKIDKAARRTFRIRSMIAAASVLLLLFVSSYVSYNEGYKLQNSQLVTLENPLGIRSSITLSDGTKVTLNAGTVLTYPTAFVSARREVKVKGEAFFEVTHDAERPFVVEAGSIRVKVLGTKFNVKAYEEEENIEVTLEEGKVGIGLNAEKQLIKMAPKQLVRYNKVSRTFVKQQIDLDYYTSWKEGKFYFRNVTLQDIARRLERSFNVHIHIASDKLKNTVCTGDFVRGENLEQILRVMTIDKRIKHKIEGDQVYIEEK